MREIVEETQAAGVLSAPYNTPRGFSTIPIQREEGIGWRSIAL